MHLTYRFAPEIDPEQRLNVKIEINTREHASAFGLVTMPFAIRNDWHRAEAEIVTFAPEELFGTKLRALLQRRKNRDLFDLHHGLEVLSLDHERVIVALEHYLAQEGNVITRAHAEQRMLEKLTHSLTEDIAPLLPASVEYDAVDALGAFEQVWRSLITRLQGDPWQSTEQALEDLRAAKYPTLLTS
jgi:predicted nucleotidyltransferase component of viral defense system